MTSDEITLVLPRRRPYYRVAHLVLGGLAVRLDLTFESLEDLQLALAGLLERPGGQGDVTVTLRVEDDAVHAVVGPFDGDQLRNELERDSDDSLSLRRILDTVVDHVEVGNHDGGAWVEVTKAVRVGARQ